MALARSGKKGGGVTGGIAPPMKKKDDFPLMSFVKDNCKFFDEPIDGFYDTSEDALRAAKDSRFQELLNQAAVCKSQQVATSSDSDSEERQKALQKIHEMEWIRNQSDNWKVPKPNPIKPPNELACGDFLKPLPKTDEGEYFSGTRKSKTNKERKRNRSVSEVVLLDAGKIMPVSGEASTKNNSKKVVTNLPLRRDRVSVPATGLPFSPGPPISNQNNVWMQRSGSDLFSDSTAHNVTRDEEAAFALAIAESLKTAKEEQNRRNMLQLHAHQFTQTFQEKVIPPEMKRPPPDPCGTVWDSDDENIDKPRVLSQSSKGDNLFHPRQSPTFWGNESKNEVYGSKPKQNLFAPEEKTSSDKIYGIPSCEPYVPLPQRHQRVLPTKSSRTSSLSEADRSALKSNTSHKCEAPSLSPLLSKSPTPEVSFSDLGQPVGKFTSKVPQNSLGINQDASKPHNSEGINRSSSFKRPIQNFISLPASEDLVSDQCQAIDECADFVGPDPLSLQFPPEIQRCDELVKNDETAQPSLEFESDIFGEKPVRLPQTMPSLILAMSSNKSSLSQPTTKYKKPAVEEAPVEPVPVPDMKLNALGKLSSPPCKDQVEAPSGGKHFDMNMNVNEKAKHTDKIETLADPPLSSGPMPTNGPWQFASLPQFNSALPSLFPPVIPDLNSPGINPTFPFVSPIACEMATQAQLASMQMMFLQQAMGSVPSFFPPSNQGFLLPHPSSASVLPSLATLGLNNGLNQSSPNAIPNPMAFGMFGMQGNPLPQAHSTVQPGMFNHSANSNPSIGKGRGRLSRLS